MAVTMAVMMMVNRFLPVNVDNDSIQIDNIIDSIYLNGSSGSLSVVFDTMSAPYSIYFDVSILTTMDINSIEPIGMFGMGAVDSVSTMLNEDSRNVSVTIALNIDQSQYQNLDRSTLEGRLNGLIEAVITAVGSLSFNVSFGSGMHTRTVSLMDKIQIIRENLASEIGIYNIRNDIDTDGDGLIDSIDPR